MYELKKNIGKVVTSKFVGTGPSFYKKRIYRAAISQWLRNTALGWKSNFIVANYCIIRRCAGRDDINNALNEPEVREKVKSSPQFCVMDMKQ
jgi:hypothetical protein